MALRIESLESRLLFALDPTAREQELLEMLNRFRADPQAELAILTNGSDASVNDAVAFFNVDMTVLSQQFDALEPAQPLAWNEALRTAAIGHTQAMYDADSQTHQAPGEPNLAQRIKNAGYKDMSVAGENVFAFAESMVHAHASFAIDWGNDINGIQNPPGHRDNMMDAEYREIGMGIFDVPSGVQKDVGPTLVSQEFASHYSFGNSWYLGTVYNDANANGQYNAGEGIAGASITLTGAAGTFKATSMSAGGYQVKVPAGTYSVMTSSAGLGGIVSLSSITIGSVNVKQDFVPSQVQFGNLNAGILTISGTSGDDITGITRSNGTLRVRRNGVLQTFTLSHIQRLNVYGSTGNDVIDFSGISIPTYVDAGTGNDFVTGGAASDTITGGADKDTIYGGDGDDRINGNGTSDRLFGEAGTDRLYGGAGNDRMDGGGAVDRLFGGEGNDTLLGGSSNDKLYGESGSDQLFGQAQSDLLDGGSQSDSAQDDLLDVRVSIESVLV